MARIVYRVRDAEKVPAFALKLFGQRSFGKHFFSTFVYYSPEEEAWSLQSPGGLALIEPEGASIAAKPLN